MPLTHMHPFLEAAIVLDYLTICMCNGRHIQPDCLQIEEGEVDTDRSRQFSACFRRLHKKEQDELMRQQREERLAKRRDSVVA